MSISWKQFWNREQHLYVSQRHLVANYETLARDVHALLPSTRPLVLLDWGCGDALSAPLLAAEGIEVLLYDPVENVEGRLRERFTDTPHVTILSPEAYAACPSGSVDVILIHSVLQYLSKEEFTALLPRLRTLLRPEGQLLLGDVVPPSISMLDDVQDLLSAGLSHGFFLDALKGLCMTFFSDYRAIRKANGFSTYSAPEIINLLEETGYRAERVPKNIGLCPHRMLIRATPRGPGSVV